MIKEKKTTSITFRLKPEIKNMLKIISQNECRSMASMIELLIREHNRHKSQKFPSCIHGLVMYCNICDKDKES